MARRPRAARALLGTARRKGVERGAIGAALGAIIGAVIGAGGGAATIILGAPGSGELQRGTEFTITSGGAWSRRALTSTQR